MEIGEQVQALARLHDFSAVQGAFTEIERLHEMGLAVREVFLRDGRKAHLRFLVARDEHHLPFPHLEVGIQDRMAPDYLQDGIPDSFRIQGARKGPDDRQVIDRLGRGLHTLEVEAFLLESQRLRAGPV